MDYNLIEETTYNFNSTLQWMDIYLNLHSTWRKKEENAQIKLVYSDSDQQALDRKIEQK